MKILIFVTAVAGLGVMAFAFFGDMQPDAQEMSVGIAIPGPAVGNGN